MKLLNVESKNGFSEELKHFFYDFIKFDIRIILFGGIMTQDERRFWLILYLLKENEQAGEYFGLEKSNGGGFVIPSGEEDQRNLLRALMNIREPYEASEEFFRIQDEYLKERNLERGITDLEKLSPFGSDKRIYLWKGDITLLNADAIVNAANSQLLGCFSPLHSCIDNCIHTFSGIQLRLECSKIMKEQGHLEKTGKAKITGAYNLPSKYVLHTVGPIIQNLVLPQHKILLADCYKNCLELASENNLESVAFCCVSTGVFNFPSKLAAEIAVKTVKSFLDRNLKSSVKKIVFNVFSEKDFEIYKGILSE